MVCVRVRVKGASAKPDPAVSTSPTLCDTLRIKG